MGLRRSKRVAGKTGDVKKETSAALPVVKATDAQSLLTERNASIAIEPSVSKKRNGAVPADINAAQTIDEDAQEAVAIAPTKKTTQVSSRKRKQTNDHESTERHKRARIHGTENIQDLATIGLRQPIATGTPLKVDEIIRDGVSVTGYDAERRGLIEAWAMKVRDGHY